MKKIEKVKLLSAVAVALFAFHANVKAEEVSTEVELNTCVSKTEEVCTLKNDIELSKNLKIPVGSKITLELNGKTLDVASITDNYGITIKGDLTITGDGTVNVGVYGIGTSTSGGNLTIKGGTYNSVDGNYIFGIFGGTTIIEDGTFNGNYCVVNAFVEYTGKAIVNGGTFIIDKEYDGGYEPFNVLGNTTVNGGNFNKEVTDYIGEGKTTKDIDGIQYVGGVYPITLNKVENAKVTIGESAITGESVTLTIEENSGYKVKNITVVDENNQSIKVTDDTFVMPDSAVTVRVEMELIQYEVIDGGDQEIKVEEGKEIIFRIDADFSLFEKLYIDGEEVSKDNYTATSGSTIIILKSDYAKTLATGNHKFKVTFTNGGSASTEFSVISSVDNPDTADGIIIYLIMCVGSVVGLFGLNLYISKKYQINNLV